MGEIAVGDEVLIPAGGSATVAGVFPQGVRPVRVTTADGRWAEACDEHLWEVEVIDHDEWEEGRDGGL